MPIEALFSPYIGELEPYEAPDWPALAAAAGLRPEELVRLDANESPYGPLPAARHALAWVDGYRLYPDYSVLEAAVARYAGVEPQNIVLGNGDQFPFGYDRDMGSRVPLESISFDIVPEPATLSLIAAASGCLLWFRRRFLR